MDWAFLKGIAIGFSIAAPVGPIGVLCIRRSLANGARTGFATGMGAAAADAIYGAVAAFGLTAISGFLLQQQFYLRVVGGMFLLYLGVKTFFSKPGESAASPATHAGAFSSTLLLTLTNPMTIFWFLGIFVGLGIKAGNYLAAAAMTFGVFVGSAAWWLFLSNAAAYFRSRITPAWMQNINRLSGVIITAFAAAAIGPLLFK